MAMLLTAAAMLGSCSFVRAWETIETEWWPNARVEADSQALDLAVFVGSSSCTSFESIHVVESSDQVRVTALVASRVKRAWEGEITCTTDAAIHRVTVELADPLGERSLVGCHPAGPDANVWVLDLPTDEPCTSRKDSLSARNDPR